FTKTWLVIYCPECRQFHGAKIGLIRKRRLRWPSCRDLLRNHTNAFLRRSFYRRGFARGKHPSNSAADPTCPNGIEVVAPGQPPTARINCKVATTVKIRAAKRE